MYQKKSNSWIKHLDFMIVDIVCLQLAFVLAYIVRYGVENPYRDRKYMVLAVVFSVVDVCVAIIFSSFKNVLKRNVYKEFAEVIQHVLLVEGVLLLYLFSTQSGEVYSRIFFYLLCPLYIGITFSGRYIWKKRLSKRNGFKTDKALIIVAPYDRLEESIKNICETSYSTFSSVGLVAADEQRRGEKIRNIPIVANYDEITEYICQKWVDEVVLISPAESEYPLQMEEELKRMGVVVHIVFAKADDFREKRQQIERFGNYMVLTTGLNCVSAMQLFIKRTIDVAGGLIGCLFSLILLIILGPIIYYHSPGPILFKQERVGRNGKKFKMYKFRTMYPDAEERKQELLAQNRVGDGMMFKVDFDPRIIGNQKMENGTVKKGIGSFLRETSLDEFPQMFNVLCGSMSLVGTRPPTVDEWEKYEPHHRARLAFKPGLTGLWQVSGRSNITDFEEVVRLDTKYIEEWSVWLDIKILLKTVKIVFGKNGAM